MQAFAGNSQLLPEQVWDSADVPERELITGQNPPSDHEMARTLVKALDRATAKAA